MPGVDAVPNVIDWPVFGLAQREKEALLLPELRRLGQHHRAACRPYREIVDKMGLGQADPQKLEDFPFLPVRLFKTHRLISAADQDVVKTMTSSGTSGHRPSQIFLDKETSALQVKVLSRIMTDLIGPKRLPMLVIDSKATVGDRQRFSARAAGILGFTMFGRDVEFALNDDMKLDLARVSAWLDKHAGQDILLFGFTYIVWLHLVTALEAAGHRLDLDRAILLHGGGWKKLAATAISHDVFRQRVLASTGIARCHDYYGMVEQTGSIFTQCSEGFFHASAWSDLIVRDPLTLKPLPYNELGLLQVFSTIPHSYPGHVLLTEDVGRMIGHDDCRCGRKGVYFTVEGRLAQAETRGCSDTYSA